MTSTERARRVFHAYMERAKKRPLTEAEKLQLAKARQLLRRARRPAMNAARGVPDSFVSFLRAKGYIEATFRPDILEQTYAGFRKDRRLYKEYLDWLQGESLIHGGPGQASLFNPLSKTKARQILHEGKAGGRPLTPAQRRFFGARASGYPRRNRKPTLDEATDYRLQQIREAFESGISKQTGQVIRAGGTGEVVGRIKGVKSGFPELAILDKDAPASIAAAIRRGKGKVYDRVRWAVARGFEKTGQFSPRARSTGRRSVQPHGGRPYCKLCKTTHTKGEHRAHGKGAFHRTHLFSFGKGKANPRRGLVRMGRLIELRYDRDHGAHPGFYKHVFKSKPTVYYDPRTNQILVKGGR